MLANHLTTGIDDRPRFSQSRSPLAHEFRVRSLTDETDVLALRLLGNRQPERTRKLAGLCLA